MICSLFIVDKQGQSSSDIETDSSGSKNNLVLSGESASQAVPLANRPTDSSIGYQGVYSMSYYEDKNRGGIMITRIVVTSWYGDGLRSNVRLSIPSSYAGQAVVGIADNCYTVGHCTGGGYYHGSHDSVPVQVSYLKLPSTIKYIGSNSFAESTSTDGYNSYQNVNIDLSACSKLEYIGNNAFYSPGTTKNIIGLPDQMPNLTYVGSNAFREAIKVFYDDYDFAVIMPNIVTVGDYAFYGCSTLKFVQFGNNLTTLGVSAFEGCVRIESITLPVSIHSIGRYCFKGCTMLATVNAEFTDFHEAVSQGTLTTYQESVGVFEECTSLSVISISDDVTYIPDRTFYDCTALSDLRLSPNVTKLGEYSFYSTNFFEFELPEHTTEVGQFAFANCKSLIAFDFTNVETLGAGVFSGCPVLEEVVLPATLQEVGTQLFIDCEKLTKVTFLSDVLNDKMFENCISLTSVKFKNPNALAKIPARCFYGCTSLAELDVIDDNKPGLEEIGEYAFYKTAFTKIELIKNQNTIGDYAFAEMPNLTSVKLNVAMISAHMFEKCPELTTLVIGTNVANGSGKDPVDTTDWAVKDYAFYQCPKLTSIEIHNDVIGAHMFDGCTSLERVVIPDSVDYVGMYSFANCTELSDVTLNNGVLGSYMFYNDENLVHIQLSNKFKYIPEYAFYGSYLLDIVIPQSIIGIGVSAFEASKQLTSVTILNNCIGERMFTDCISLPYVEIPASVEQDFTAGAEDKVGKYAFAGCIALAEVDILNNYISEGMFSGCTLLGNSKRYTLVIPESVEDVGKSAFGACTFVGIDGVNKTYSGCINLHFVDIGSKKISESMFEGCSSLENVTVEATVETVDARAFANCTTLSTVVLNNTYTSAYMFSGCTNLTSVTLSEEFETISAYSFENCINLGEFTIESTAFKEIGNYAFKNCQSLVGLTVPSTATKIGEGAFYGCADLSVLTLPYVGGRKTVSGAALTEEDLFVYLFGKPVTTDTVYNAVKDSFYSVTSKCSSSKSYTANLPKSLKTVNITDEQVYGYGAFQNCAYIQSITVPSSAVEIQSYAFENCSALSSLTIGANVSKYGDFIARNCIGLESVTIHSKTMGLGMFDSCINLHYVSIANVENIPDRAFYSCGNSSSYDAYEVRLGNTKTIGSYAFYSNRKLNVITLPDSITSIDEYAFYNCELIQFIQFPLELTTLGQHAFEKCYSFENIILPEKLTTIYTDAFVECTNLKSVLFDGHVMGPHMFKKCTSLYLVNFNDISVIREYGFQGCTSLAKLELPSNVTTLESYAFDGCTSLTELIIPSTIVSKKDKDGREIAVGDHVFSNCTSLKYVKMENNVLGTYMFENDTALEQIYLSPTLVRIPEYCFNGCTSLRFPDIPASITEIGSFAFAGCLSLSELVIPNTVQRMGASVFYNVSLTKITLPFVGNQRNATYKYNIGGSGNNTDWNNQYSIYHGYPSHIGYIFGSGDKPYTIGNSYSCSTRVFYAHWGNNSCMTMTAYLPHSLKEVVVTDDPTITGMAFYGARLIEKLTISNVTTSIESRSFYGMYQLKELTVPSICNGGDSYFAHWFLWIDFYGNTCSCTSADYLRAMWYQDGNYVYYVNQNNAVGYVPKALKKINFTNTSTVINYALSGLTELEEVNFADGLTTIGNYAFSNSGLKSITIPSTVTSMGVSIVSGNARLKTAIINSSMITNESFKGCTTLTDVRINGTNVIVGNNVFENCTGLRSIAFGKNVLSVGTATLAGCSSLELLSIANLGIESNHNLAYLFGTIAVTGMVLNTGLDINDQTLTRYLPSGLSVNFVGTEVSSYALNGLTAISGLSIEEGVNSIGDYAFANLTIDEIRFPSTAKEIGEYVCYNNADLTTAIFGEKLTVIPAHMFEECVNLVNVFFETDMQTITYVFVSNNVYEKFIDGVSTNKFYALTTPNLQFTNDSTDLTLATKINGQFYLYNEEDYSYKSVGPDQMLGTNDDLYVTFLDGDVIPLKLIQNEFYYVYGDGTYIKVDLQPNGGYELSAGSVRVCLLANGTLENVIMLNGKPYLATSNPSLYRGYGSNTILGDSNDTYLHYGSSQDFNTPDNIENVIEYNGKLYKSFLNNVYQELIITPYSPASVDEDGNDIPEIPYSVSLAEPFGAGPDKIIGTADDIVRRNDYNADHIIVTIDDINRGKIQVALDTLLPIYYNAEDGTHYLVTYEGNYLGYGADGLLGTKDDKLLGGPTGNIKEQQTTEIHIDDPARPTVTFVSKNTLENKMYNTITEIGERAFYNCTSLEELELSERLKTIETEAFRKAGLTSVVVPASVQTYGEYTFAETKSMTEANVKSTQNGVYMFFESNIEDVTLAIDTAYIAKGAFKNCVYLKTVTFVTHFIEEIKYKLPYGEITTEEYDKSQIVSYILLFSVLNGTGLDGISGTLDDTYTQDGKTYIVGESCTIGGGTEIEVAINAETEEIYKVLGENLYILLELDYANNIINEVGSIICAGPSLDIFNESDNIDGINQDSEGNYYFVIDNVKHYAGANQMLGTSND
ncbi:MAG: leucine-rich repeat domain-containing protein, partial [Anaeroplasmataceae bacterium]|nr:leucine-rich repeat domain-containing protein [Anaeroplasmataceae bacterium]